MANSIPQVCDDGKLFAHWIWMLGDSPEGIDTQPDGERWTITPAPEPEPAFRPITPQDLEWLAEYDAQRCEERTALLTRYPLNYEPADLDDAEEFAVTADDLAYQRGYACGYDGHLAAAPGCLTEDESAAWTEGWTEGYYAYINELERDYVLGHPDRDPDPWNEAHSPLAGHPAGE